MKNYYALTRIFWYLNMNRHVLCDTYEWILTFIWLTVELYIDEKHCPVGIPKCKRFS